MATTAAERKKKKASKKAAKKAAQKAQAKATHKEKLQASIAKARTSKEKKKARDAMKNLKQRRRRWPPIVSPPCGTRLPDGADGAHSVLWHASLRKSVLSMSSLSPLLLCILCVPHPHSIHITIQLYSCYKPN